MTYHLLSHDRPNSGIFPKSILPVKAKSVGPSLRCLRDHSELSKHVFLPLYNSRSALLAQSLTWLGAYLYSSITRFSHRLCIKHDRSLPPTKGAAKLASLVLTGAAPTPWSSGARRRIASLFTLVHSKRDPSPLLAFWWKGSLSRTHSSIGLCQN